MLSFDILSDLDKRPLLIPEITALLPLGFLFLHMYDKDILHAKKGFDVSFRQILLVKCL